SVIDEQIVQIALQSPNMLKRANPLFSRPVPSVVAMHPIPAEHLGDRITIRDQRGGSANKVVGANLQPLLGEREYPAREDTIQRHAGRGTTGGIGELVTSRILVEIYRRFALAAQSAAPRRAVTINERQPMGDEERLRHVWGGAKGLHDLLDLIRIEEIVGIQKADDVAAAARHAC